MSVPTTRVGSRASALALAQTALVVDALRKLGLVVETVTVSTGGDRARS